MSKRGDGNGEIKISKRDFFKPHLLICTDSYLSNVMNIGWGTNYEEDTICSFGNYAAISYHNLCSRHIEYYGKNNC